MRTIQDALSATLVAAGLALMCGTGVVAGATATASTGLDPIETAGACVLTGNILKPCGQNSCDQKCYYNDNTSVCDCKP